MKRWFKKHFVPHEGNFHRPWVFERGVMGYVFGAAVLIELLVFMLPMIAFPTLLRTLNLSAVLPGALSTLTNDARTAENAPALTENALLDQAATLKAEDMAAKGYFSHVTPDGKTPWYWFNLVGYEYSYAGENLAVNFSDSADVVEAWMNSPSHRANIVNSHYKEIGTGVATGEYKGREAVFAVELFGAPRSLAAVNGAAPLGAWQAFVASPHQSANALLLALLILVGSSLIAVCIIPPARHPDIIVRGLLLMVVIVGFYVANDFLAQRHFETSFVASGPLAAGEGSL